MKLKSIKQKISISFIAVILIPMVLSTSVSMFMLNKLSKKSYLSSMEKNTDNLNNIIDKTYDKYESILNLASENFMVKSSLSAEKNKSLLNELERIKKSDAGLINVYVATESNKMTMYPEDEATTKNYNPKSKAWYKQSLKTQDIIWVDAYVDRSSKKMVISAFKGVKDPKGNVIGSIGMDIDISNIQNSLKGIKTNKTEDIVLLDTTGIAIGSTNNDFIGKNLNPSRVNKNLDIKDESIKNIYEDKEEFSWMNNVMKSNNGDIKESFLGNKKYIHYYTNKRSGCKIMSLVNEKEVLSGSFTTALLLLGLSIAFLVVSILLAMKISNSIVLPIKELELAMEKGESGELNINTNIKSKDEVGKLGRIFNGMIKAFRDIVFAVRNSTDKVVHFSDILKNQSAEVTENSKEITRAITEISQGVQQQAAEAQNATAIANDFINNLGQIETFNSEINKEGRDMEKNNNKSIESVKILKDKNNLTNKATKDISTNIEELSKQTESIGEILNAMLSISSQTNLLALNAAIEAARAGEAGKGFAVVAEEVRKLAEQSSSYAENIKKMIDGIKNTMKYTVDSMERIEENIEEQSNAVQLTEDNFYNLNKSINKIAGTINNMSSKIDDMMDKSGKLNVNIENISAVSEESAASIEEVTASINSQLEEIERVKDSSEELNNLAEDLKSLIKGFSV